MRSRDAWQKVGPLTNSTFTRTVSCHNINYFHLTYIPQGLNLHIIQSHKMPNKLSQFWQELKRRNVVRVLTVYAGAAFVIIELINNITEPLHLPEWTPTLVIVLLAIGIPVAIVFSWIYDVHPKEGMVKTKPADKNMTKDIPKPSNKWKIASYISFVVIVGLIVLNVIPWTEKKMILDKSIAILPFQNLSQEEGNEYFVDGLVDDLLNKISVIGELRVTSRTSSDMYRERGIKSVPEIASELNVSYILEGSVQRYGKKAKITVQLIDAVHDDHIWTKNYDRELVDIFKTQSEIAIEITSELDAILTSEQRSIIQEDKTNNIKAFELYQMGLFYWNKRTREGNLKSIEYFEEAIVEDPAYGLAYAGLADTYFLMTLGTDQQELRDEAEELAQKALELDENLAEAYTVLASVYDYFDWEWEKAEKFHRRALELNPNYSTAHLRYANHLSILRRHEEARIHINKAIELNPLSFVLRHESLKFYYHQGRFEEALAELIRCNELHENHPWIRKYYIYLYRQLHEEKILLEPLLNSFSTSSNDDSVKEIYSESGIQGVIDYEIKMLLKLSEEEFELEYRVAWLYGMIGEDEKAIEWLEKYVETKKFPLHIIGNQHVAIVVPVFVPFQQKAAHPHFHGLF